MTCCHAMLEDNTCHFGVNNFFSDLGLKSKHAPDTQLFFPADVHQTSKVVEGFLAERLALHLHHAVQGRPMPTEKNDKRRLPFLSLDMTF
jgi:hypothetical protein